MQYFSIASMNLVQRFQASQLYHSTYFKMSIKYMRDGLQQLCGDRSNLRLQKNTMHSESKKK